VSEPREPCAVKVDDQRLVGSAKRVDPHVELLPPQEKRVGNVPLHDVRLRLRVIRVIAEVVLPLGDLLDFVEKENALALGLADGLHDPQNLRVRLNRLLLELLIENRVLGRQVERDREEVVPEKRSRKCPEAQRLRLGLLMLPLLFEDLLVALQVLDHQVLPRQLNEIIQKPGTPTS
jgi:hypothetical protein